MMSRRALDGFPFGDVEKDYFFKVVKRLSKVYFSEILGLCFALLNYGEKNVLHICAAK